MASKSAVRAVLWGVAVLTSVACTGEPYSETCGAGQDCASLEGSSVDIPVCEGENCSCVREGDVLCCPGGLRECAVELRKCIPEAFCEGATPLECSSDDDCPGPPDSRCGVGVCIDGACSKELWAWKELPNQYPGDCTLIRCSCDGELAESDAGARTRTGQAS